MNSFWTKDLKEEEERTKFKQRLRGSRDVLDKVKEYSESKLSDAEPKKADYDNPSWAYKEADRLGYERALKEIIEFVTLNDK